LSVLTGAVGAGRDTKGSDPLAKSGHIERRSGWKGGGSEVYPKDNHRE